MTDLKTQLRTYYESTTVPVDIADIVVDPDTMLVGRVPEAAQRRHAMQGRKFSDRAGDIRFKGIGTLLGATAAIVVAVLVGFALLSFIDAEEPDAGTDGTATLLRYIAADNARDVDAVMTFFTEESVITGAPRAGIAIGTPDVLATLADIRTWQVESLAGRTEFLNVQVDGAVVRFDHIWTPVDTPATPWCGQGHTAVVEDGKILSWNWPEYHPCR